MSSFCCSELNSVNYHKCISLRSAVSWVTPMAVTDPTIVFDSHPSCQSGSRTKASKARLMTSCLGSAPYRRGLNTVQLAFCVWSRFSVPRIDSYYLLGLRMHARTHNHTHTCASTHPLDPWTGALSQEWALRQGVTTGTAARVGSQSYPPQHHYHHPQHPQTPPPLHTHIHTHTDTVPQPQPPASQTSHCFWPGPVVFHLSWNGYGHGMTMRLFFQKRNCYCCCCCCYGCWVQTHLILNLLVQFAPSTLLWTINKPAFSKVER